LPQAGEIVTAAGVAGTNWIVWRATPEAALLEPLSKARGQALRNAAAVTAVLGLLTLWIVRRQLRPLRQLAARAQDLFAAGKDVHDGWPKVGGEVGAVVEVLRHVGAERAHLETFTAKLLGQLNSVMSAAPLGIAFTRYQRFELVNQAWCRLLRYGERDLVGSPASVLFANPEDYQCLGPLVGESFASEGAYAGEWRLRRQDGTVFWGQLNGRPVDPTDPDAGTIWTLDDVTAVRESRERLEWSAYHDPLTGLANRAAFERRLKIVIQHPPAALLLIDLDRFKPINDRHGHGAGDAMLQQVAEALQSHVRAGDLAVRLGGDEFAILLERCPLDAVPRVADTVLQAITGARLIWEGHTLSVGASIGVALLGDDPASQALDTAAWVAAADKACYDAKASGRGVVRVAGQQAGPEAGAG
jgi:diguanylate cyclase (GGDEF)-like protein/PAS domain S-box-containing protein